MADILYHYLRKRGNDGIHRRNGGPKGGPVALGEGRLKPVRTGTLKQEAGREKKKGVQRLETRLVVEGSVSVRGENGSEGVMLFEGTCKREEERNQSGG